MTQNNDKDARYSSKRDEYEEWRESANSSSNDTRYKRTKSSREDNNPEGKARYSATNFSNTTKRSTETLDIIGAAAGGIGLLTSWLGGITIFPALACIVGIILGVIGYRKGSNLLTMVAIIAGGIGLVISLLFGIVFGLFFAIVGGIFRLIF